MGPDDDCDTIVDIMLQTNYNEELCVGTDWDPAFIARLMKAGFLVMSERLIKDKTLVLPKLHLVRSALFFPELHVKKSVRRFLDRYELRFNENFDYIVQKCVEIHGDYWLTPELLDAIRWIRRGLPGPDGGLVRPVSFALYRGGVLVAGEFGIVAGRVYTSYSGYHEEDNSGTVQMILMIRWLEKAGFDFLDFGMPLDYKADMGARNISPEEFVWRFRAAQG